MVVYETIFENGLFGEGVGVGREWVFRRFLAGIRNTRVAREVSSFRLEE